MYNAVKDDKDWEKYYKKDENNEVIFDNGVPVLDTDKNVLGHVDGFENWRLNQMAEERNMTQAELNAFVKEDTNTIYEIEGQKENASHAGEDHNPLGSGIKKDEIDTLMNNYCASLDCGKT